MKKKAFTLLALITSLTACTLAKVDVDVIGGRTSLENQVIGTANLLEGEMLAVASVRGVDPSGRFREPPKQSGDAKDAVRAMQVLEFNADDISAFKAFGWVGEGKNGYLAKFPLEKAQVPPARSEYASRFTKGEYDSIVDKVNEARKTVMTRVINMNPSFTMKDMPAVEAIFGKINREAALPGEKVELPEGGWITVKKQ